MSEANSGQAARGPTYRAALAAVIILGVLLLAGLVALVLGFMRQDQISRANQAAGSAPAVIALEPGARILSAKTASNRLVLQLATPEGQEVEVMDLATGKLLFRTAPSP